MSTVRQPLDVPEVGRRLVLDDIDWRQGEIVIHGKADRWERLPLPIDVGEAVAGYLRWSPSTHRVASAVLARESAHSGIVR